MVLRNLFGPKWEAITVVFRRLHHLNFCVLLRWSNEAGQV